MEHHMKTLLENLRPRKTRETAQSHLTRLDIDDDRNEVTLYVDKRYAFNQLIGQEHIQALITGVKKTFGDDAETVVKLEDPHSQHEREKALPHTIHYS